MRKFLFSKNNILQLVACHGVGASPYHRPENLEVVLDKLNDILTPLFAGAELGFLEMSYEEIKDFVFKHTTAIPEFEAWNEPKINSDHPLIGTASRYHTIKPDYDFIDLHALARNVANDILWNSEGAKLPIPIIITENKVD